MTENLDSWQYICCLAPIIILIGTIKGALNCLFVAIYGTIGCTLSVIYWFVPNCYYIYWKISRINSIGPNLKFLVRLTIWLPFLLYTVTTPFFAFIGFLVLGFVYPILISFADDQWLLISGIVESYQIVTDFFHYFNKDINQQLSVEFHQEITLVLPGNNLVPNPAPEGVPFDIPLLKLPWIFFFSIFNGVCVWILIFMDTTLCFPLFTIRCVFEIWRFYFERNHEKLYIYVLWRIVLFLPFLLFHAILFTGIILLYAVANIGSFFYTSWKTAGKCNQEGNLVALQEAFRIAHSFHEYLNDFIMTGKNSVL